MCLGHGEVESVCLWTMAGKVAVTDLIISISVLLSTIFGHNVEISLE